MRQNNIFFFVTLLLLNLTSCIKSYYPEIRNEDAVKFVVTGQVNKGDTVQYVNISTTAPISKYYHFSPVSGCIVNIIDDKGNSYDATDMQDGNYKFSVPESKLMVGSSFMVDIYIPGKDISKPEPVHIISDLDQINDCPDVDSVYYILDAMPNLNPLIAIKGIKFYVDLDARNSASHYFRWEAAETWEYHAPLASVLSNDRICWMTKIIKDAFVLSTENLTENIYKHYPFHFVDNISSQRLAYGYSLLIRQYSLSSAAYEYWEKIRVNSTEQGGLYESQPLVIKGNLHNLTNPDNQVLGFFGTSSVKSKRIFVKNVIAYIGIECVPIPGEKIPPECFHCILSGGTNIKPGFWPY